MAPGVTGRSRLTEVTDVQRERACVRTCMCGCVRAEEALFLDFFSSLMELDLPVDAHLNVSSDISSPPVKYGPFRRHPPTPSHLPSSVMNGSGLCLLSRLEGGEGLVTSVFKFWRRLRQKLLWRRRRRRVSDEWRVCDAPFVRPRFRQTH